MKQFSINQQITIIAILPALIVAAILSSYYMWRQSDYISHALNENGMLLAKQLSPAAEYAVYSGNLNLIKPLIETIIENNPVLRIQILDKDNNRLLDVKKQEKIPAGNSNILNYLFSNKRQIDFSEPIISAQISVDDQIDQFINDSKAYKKNQIGQIVVTISTQHATEKKLEQISHGIIITLFIILSIVLIVFKISSTITRPIKSLTQTVKNITAGNLDTKIESNASGEIGILQSCINNMAEELKLSRSDMENQLNEYTHELQQTMEELEIRNAELDITRSKAIYANNAKSEFLANMSHEIRTPLSGVIGFTELLQDTKLSTQQKDYTDTIQKSAKNLLEIINDILDLSKIESGKTEITPSNFNLVDIIEDIINLSSPAALEKDIEIFYRIEKDVPNLIQADPFRMHQILTNLIGNAIKFTDEGYVYLQVTRDNLSNSEDIIKFTVTDTGIGMNSNDRQNLFKAFSQADTSITRRFGGTGLGLVISRKLTILMRGEMGFDSVENKGSTFWFCIPVIALAEEHQLCQFDHKRIAFINNHPVARQAFITMFDDCHCQVTDYDTNKLDDLATIENSNDLLVLFLSRKEITQGTIVNKIATLQFSIPSLLIASTRSHTELKYLKQHVFDNAVFSSEKIERIKQKIAATISKNSHNTEPEPDTEIYNDTTSIDWSNISIMVVDDNAVNLRLAEIILHKHNAKVTTAITGSQAINYASMNSYDIIFMDLHMPGIDGYETTRKIREITPGKQPVIIALTANTLPQEKQKVSLSGMDDIIIKPVSDSIMKEIVNDWLLNDPTNHLIPPDSIDIDSTAPVENNTVFSIERARQFTGNNEELAYELFAMLRNELPDHRDAITDAAANNNLEALRAHVHKLHGASRCCGTAELITICNYVENLIIQSADFNIDKEIAVLQNAIQNVLDYKFEHEKNIEDSRSS